MIGEDGLSYPPVDKRICSDHVEIKQWKFELPTKRLNILLVEPNYYTRYPPLGLLKLSAFHRNRGDFVSLVRFPEKPQEKPDLIYVTSLFTYAWQKVHDAVKYYKELFPNAPVVLGGIYASLLPDHAASSGADFVSCGVLSQLENIMPDYSIIKKWNWDSNIIFSSRGCVRQCGFCAVPILEGKLTIRDKISDLVDHSMKKIILWDNNILAAQNSRKVLEELIDIGFEVDFNQGLDAKFINSETVKMIRRLRTRQIRLAYDNSNNAGAIQNAINCLKVSDVPLRNVIVYTLFNYQDSPEDFLRRVTQLLQNGVVSYPMRYEPLCVLKKNEFIGPKWTPQKIDMVQRARRVIGYAGAFPPYKALVEKIRRAKTIEEAFLLRPRLEEIRREIKGISETDAKLLYIYYKNRNLTTRDLPLVIAFRDLKSLETQSILPVIPESKKKQKRLGGSSDWR